MLLIDVVGGAGAFGIKKSILRGDLDGGTEGGNAEFDAIFAGQGGTNFDEAFVGGKTFVQHFEAIKAEGEIAGSDEADIVGRESAMKLDGVTGEFCGRFKSEAIRVGDFEAEFSG